jgi:hypothetical protein
MRPCCDVLVQVPSKDTPFIQQVHIALGHTLCAIAEDAIAERGTGASPPSRAPQHEPGSA